MPADLPPPTWIANDKNHPVPVKVEGGRPIDVKVVDSRPIYVYLPSEVSFAAYLVIATLGLGWLAVIGIIVMRLIAAGH